MAERQWEYCELGLGEWRKHEKGLLSSGKEGWSYDCYVRYYSPTGDEIFRQLATIGQLLPFNPFSKAMGQLGVSGWELVSVQFGNRVETGSSYHDSGYIRWNKLKDINYFKTVDEVILLDIAGMRDHFIHAYDTVDWEEVWKTATSDVPGLLVKIEPWLPKKPVG